MSDRVQEAIDANLCVREIIKLEEDLKNPRLFRPTITAHTYVVEDGIAALRQRVAELERERDIATAQKNRGLSFYDKLVEVLGLEDERGWEVVYAKVATMTKELEAARKVCEAAEGLSHGQDWNNGTHALKHGYRAKLLAALAAYRAAQTKEQRDEKAE